MAHPEQRSQRLKILRRPMIPALALLGGLAIHALCPSKALKGIVLGWLSLGCVLYTHTDIPSIRRSHAPAPPLHLPHEMMPTALERYRTRAEPMV